MQEFVIGFGLFLVFEGLIYAAFPGGVKRMAEQLPGIEESTLRNFGLVAMALGVGLIWLIKG